jgi:hypothetical protein
MSYARTAYAGLGADLPEYNCGDEEYVVVPSELGFGPYCDSDCPEGWIVCPQPSVSGSPVCSAPYFDGQQAPPGCTISGEDVTDEEGTTDAEEGEDIITDTIPPNTTGEQVTATPAAVTVVTADPPPSPVPTWVFLAAGGTLIMLGAALLR